MCAQNYQECFYKGDEPFYEIKTQTSWFESKADYTDAHELMKNYLPLIVHFCLVLISTLLLKML